MLAFVLYFLPFAKFEETLILDGQEEQLHGSDLNHQRCLGTSNSVSETGKDLSC